MYLKHQETCAETFNLFFIYEKINERSKATLFPEDFHIKTFGNLQHEIITTFKNLLNEFVKNV